METRLSFVMDLAEDILSAMVKSSPKNLMEKVRKDKRALIIADERNGSASIKFMTEMYREQHDQGRYFVHVSRNNKREWKQEDLTKLQNKTQAIVATTSKYKITTNCLGIARSINDRFKLAAQGGPSSKALENSPPTLLSIAHNLRNAANERSSENAAENYCQKLLQRHGARLPETNAPKSKMPKKMRRKAPF